MKFTMFDYGLITLIVIGLALLILIDTSDASAADLPESANLTFVNMADLDAQVDSVLAVCDTTSWREVDCWARYDSVMWRDSLWVGYAEYDTAIYKSKPVRCTVNWGPAPSPAAVGPG